MLHLDFERAKYITADAPGYCSAQSRYIADDEFIRTSIAAQDFAIQSNRRRWSANPEPYAHYLRWYAQIEKNRDRPEK
jgi:hypothetical protein